jgi:hypothetical protein
MTMRRGHAQGGREDGIPKSWLTGRRGADLRFRLPSSLSRPAFALAADRQGCREVRDQALKGESEQTQTAGRWRATAPLAGVTACLLLAAVIINPFREMLSIDDGWAYARSVEHLLRTGEYRLDAWSAANMPVQIYLAAGLSKAFGYSLSLLRFTPIAMLALGLASFYGLARELGAARWTSSAATLALLASPLVLLLSFTFMSDVQFMGWMLARCSSMCGDFGGAATRWSSWVPSPLQPPSGVSCWPP